MARCLTPPTKPPLDWPFGTLTPHSYSTLVADVPWSFKTYSNKGLNKSAMRHYDTMTLDDIKALPVQELVNKDAVLLLWSCGWAVAGGQAQEVARAWGFTPITEIIWCKVTKNHLPRWGTGYRVRSLHEPILLCTLGRPKHKAFPSRIDGIAREHSKKPTEAYDIFRRCTPDLLWRCDLFSAGVRHEGFEQWGEDHRTPENRAIRTAALSEAREAGESNGVGRGPPGSGREPISV